MWIPHNLLAPLKAESPKETIQASEAATEQRNFVVGFFLSNTLTKSWETDLLVSPSEDRREIVVDGVPCVVHASATVSGKLQELIYSLPATSATGALSSAFTHVDAELDRLALQYGRSFEIAGWRIADVDNQARWRCVPFKPSALVADPDPGALPSEYAEVMHLYREARNATSPAWRLIAAGAILDAAVSHRAPFDKPGVDLARHTLTTDMLVRSGTLATHPDLKGVSALALRDQMEPRRRQLIERVSRIGDDADVSESKDFYDASALAALANLVDLVARDLVLASLRAAGFLRPVEKVLDAEIVDA